MQHNYKILLGVLSILPLISLGLYLFIIFRFVFFSIQNGQNELEDPAQLVQTFLPAIAFLILGLATGVFLFVYFLILAIKDKSSTENERILWVLLLVLVSPLAFPLYWYVRLWTNPKFSINEDDLDEYKN
ncbi:MAG: hypothetical protein RLZZ337_361 [Bacteroidota bacterium]|jgi:Kef-type K+ transport system membrane component KefB